jgi:hypothetical protein
MKYILHNSRMSTGEYGGYVYQVDGTKCRCMLVLLPRGWDRFISENWVDIPLNEQEILFRDNKRENFLYYDTFEELQQNNFEVFL